MATKDESLPVIQGLWYGSAVLGQMELLSISSFLKHGHLYHLYSYDDIVNLPAGAVLMDARQIHPHFEIIRNRNGKVLNAAFSDLFRYKLLFEKGNYWADLDVVCVKPFDFSQTTVLAAERHRANAKVNYKVTSHSKVGINCNVMRFPARSPEMQFCFEQALSFDRSKLVFAEIGPQLITLCAEKFDLGRFIMAPEVFNPVNYFNHRDLVDPVKTWKLSDATHGIHLWSGAWGAGGWRRRLANSLLKRPSMDKNARFSNTTLYGQLLHQYLYA